MSMRAGLRLLSRRTADSVKRLSSAHAQCEIAQLMRSCPPPSSADVLGSASSLPSPPAGISARYFVASVSSEGDGVRSERQARGGGKAKNSVGEEVKGGGGGIEGGGRPATKRE